MSLDHILLGALETPRSGYEVKQWFDQVFSFFWNADQSQIYRTLAQLTADGLATQEVFTREEGLDRKVYHLTERGREELHRWLTTPLPPADTREPFLILAFYSMFYLCWALIPRKISFYYYYYPAGMVLSFAICHTLWRLPAKPVKWYSVKAR
jgi:DNA-binding PadR family transcriptional regulator